MGRIKQTNFHKTTISKMMKSLAILASSLAAVQARMLNDDASASALDFDGQRRLGDVEGSIAKQMDEEDCEENPRDCERRLQSGTIATKAMRKAVFDDL